MTLEDLLGEGVEAARRREREAFLHHAGRFGRKLVLFGAGRVGRRILAALRRRSIEPLAFADRDPRLQGSRVDGIEVLSPERAASRFANRAAFVVTVFRGSGDEGMAARENFLRSLGCRTVTNFLPLAWFAAPDMLPHYGADRPAAILAAASDIEKVGKLWTDSSSREAFRTQLLWRLRADFSALPPPSLDQYFPTDLFRLEPGEAVFDGGAFDGDTLRALGDRFGRAWAVEPDPDNIARLRAMLDPRITIVEAALGETPGEGRFHAGLGPASVLHGSAEMRVRIETVDRIVGDGRPTMLKLDIEGSELAALKGARATLGRSQPIVAVCLYHRPDDLWRIPEFLHEILPGHRLFLRAHQHDGFELVAYAVPAARSPRPEEDLPDSVGSPADLSAGDRSRSPRPAD